MSQEEIAIFSEIKLSGKLLLARQKASASEEVITPGVAGAKEDKIPPRAASTDDNHLDAMPERELMPKQYV